MVVTETNSNKHHQNTDETGKHHQRKTKHQEERKQTAGTGENKNHQLGKTNTNTTTVRRTNTEQNMKQRESRARPKSGQNWRRSYRRQIWWFGFEREERQSEDSERLKRKDFSLS
ncbi:hypothetical protein QL285_062608 [Trifolium repens]|nr:hypothetical protein QL285_062608 [Trifolium repens]